MTTRREVDDLFGLPPAPSEAANESTGLRLPTEGRMTGPSYESAARREERRYVAELFGLEDHGLVHIEDRPSFVWPPR